MTSENRAFEVHKAILVSVMKSQAGTLAKALLEGVMNSVDAGASKVRVNLDGDGFAIRDDGRGFQSKTEIVQWFETFGTPHEDGDAKFGRFRMGRGQLMSFAANTWRTGTFRMEVDIQGQQSLGYRLTERLAPVKGCRIEGRLYERLASLALDDVVREFTELVRYAEIPVLLNGRVISRKASEQKWDEETDDAYMKSSRTGDLLVYNMGVLVCKFSNYEFGAGGVVVSKRALTVNFARNDILRHKCDVWRRISAHLKRISIGKVAGKDALTKEERDFLARQWAYGQLPADMAGDMARVKLFTDATGRHCTLQDLARAQRLSVVSGTMGRVGSKLHREGRAFVLSSETLSRFRVDSLDELLEVIERRGGPSMQHTAAALETLALGCSDIYEVVEDTELPAAERLMLTAMRDKHRRFHDWFGGAEASSGLRELRAGQSDVALAWTDGASYVVLGRKELQRAASKGVAGCFELLLTLTHEYCHDAADLESHEHDQVFLAKHHDAIQYHGGKLLKLAEELNRHYERLLKQAGVAAEGAAVARVLPRAKAIAKAAREELFAKAQMPLSF